MEKMAKKIYSTKSILISGFYKTLLLSFVLAFSESFADENAVNLPPVNKPKIEAQLKKSVTKKENGDVVIDVAFKNTKEYPLDSATCIFHIVGAYLGEFSKEGAPDDLELNAAKSLLAKRRIKMSSAKIDTALIKKSIIAGIPIAANPKNAVLFHDEDLYNSLRKRQENREACEKIGEWIAPLKLEEKSFLDKIKKLEPRSGGGCIILGYNEASKEYLFASTLLKVNFWITERELKYILDDANYVVYFSL